jgi:FADH2 O2-dependent halogenase
MNRFPLFARISLLYFAAASYAETARRLGKPHLASSYLLREDPSFGPALRDLLQRATQVQNDQDAETLSAEILEAIEPIDVAGLRRNAGNNWFPVDASDLLRSASKLQASPDEIARMLERSGFYATV